MGRHEYTHIPGLGAPPAPGKLWGRGDHTVVDPPSKGFILEQQDVDARVEGVPHPEHPLSESSLMYSRHERLWMEGGGPHHGSIDLWSRNGREMGAEDLLAGPFPHPAHCVLHHLHPSHAACM